MKTLLTVGLSLGLVAAMGLSASAGAPAPAPRAVAGGGGLFVESADAMSTKVTVSGEIRNRWEAIRNNMEDFSSATHDHHEWVDSRVRLGLLFELKEGYEVFLQSQTRYIWGDDDSTGGDNDLELYQAYVKMNPEILGYKTTLTIGRSELALGSEMLLGNDSKYDGLSHDLVRLDVSPIENLTSSLFVAKLVDNDVNLGENPAIGPVNGAVVLNDTHLWGLWNTYQINEDALVDAYLLYLQSDQEYTAGTPTLTTMDAKLWTLGTRLKIDTFELGGQKFDASAEVAVQMGKVNFGTDLDVQDSYAFEVEGGWMVPLAWSPRLALGMAWASGDDDATDGNFNTFMPLYEDVQGRLGKADLFTLQNIRCWYTTLTCNPMENKDLTAGISYLKFNAFEEHDQLGAGGSNGLDSNVNDMADEFDVFVGYKLSDNASLKGCWSWVEPEDMIHDSLGNSPAHRIHATLEVKF